MSLFSRAFTLLMVPLLLFFMVSFWTNCLSQVTYVLKEGVYLDPQCSIWLKTTAYYPNVCYPVLLPDDSIQYEIITLGSLRDYWTYETYLGDGCNDQSLMISSQTSSEQLYLSCYPIPGTNLYRSNKFLDPPNNPELTSVQTLLGEGVYLDTICYYGWSPEYCDTSLGPYKIDYYSIICAPSFNSLVVFGCNHNMEWSAYEFNNISTASVCYNSYLTISNFSASFEEQTIMTTTPPSYAPLNLTLGQCSVDSVNGIVAYLSECATLNPNGITLISESNHVVIPSTFLWMTPLSLLFSLIS